MQIFFLVRGQKDCVDIVLNWINTRMALLPEWKNEEDYNAGKEPIISPISHLLRYNVLGYELVIPEQEADKWLTTFGFHEPPHPNTVKFKAAIKFLRIAMGLKKPKEFKTDEQVMLPSEYAKYIGFTPIGVKYDEFRVVGGKNFHEAL